jgi:peptide/nickel transport system permease protein
MRPRNEHVTQRFDEAEADTRAQRRTAEAWAGFVLFWRRYRRNRAAVFGLVCVGVFAFAAAFAGGISPYGPTSTNVGPLLSSPSLRHLMGTDDIGRDVFSAVVHGVRISIIVGVLTALTSTLIGVIVGAVAGYAGGLIDNALMRVVELFLAIPRLFLALVIVAMFGVSLVNIILVIGCLSWPATARIIRSEVLKLRNERFVEAAAMTGESGVRIVFSEILPNTYHLMLVTASLQVPAAIIVEAGLSFIGLGEAHPRSLGLMLSDAYPLMRRAWWPAVFPGLSLSLIALSFNLLGDGLNDALNPRLKA